MSQSHIGVGDGLGVLVFGDLGDVVEPRGLVRNHGDQPAHARNHDYENGNVHVEGDPLVARPRVDAVRDCLTRGLKASEESPCPCGRLDVGGETSEEPVHVQLSGVAGGLCGGRSADVQGDARCDTHG